MVQKALNEVCQSITGCQTLAYADLSTKLVLATNEGSDHTREALNALCAEADVVLAGGHFGLVGQADGFRLFLRARGEPADSLICLCDLRTDMAALLPAVERCLSEISAGGAAG